MPQYIRSHIPGGTFFFTVALLERRGSLLVEHIEGLRAAFREVQRRRPFVIDSMVVLPDHLHCLWALPPEDTDFSTRCRLIKTRFVGGIPAGKRLSTRRQAKCEQGIWQRRFWEHTIRDEADYAAHVDYIHYNPAKHGYVKRPTDWAYSSIHRFIADGRLTVDWAAAPTVENLDYE